MELEEEEQFRRLLLKMHSLRGDSFQIELNGVQTSIKLEPLHLSANSRPPALQESTAAPYERSFEFSVTDGVHSCSFDDLGQVFKGFFEYSWESIKSQDKNLSIDPLKRMIQEHFAQQIKAAPKPSESYPLFLFWYAEPILMKWQVGMHSERVVRLAPVNNLRQEETILKLLSKVNVRFERVIASPATLYDIPGREPEFLHFSGHIMGEPSKQRPKKGVEQNFMVFEDQTGKAELISLEKIRLMLDKIRRPIKFIFLASCHSKEVGDQFLKSGAHHVICIRKEEKILDEACQVFIKTFYASCILERRTICQSFEMAWKQVSVMGFPIGEEFKFVLLKGQANEHICQRLSNFQQGQFVDVTPRCAFEVIPPKFQHFVGRCEDKQRLLQEVVSNRFVSVRGVPGIGKSTLAKEVSMFLLSRRRFEDGLIFLNAEGVETADALLNALTCKLNLGEKEAGIFVALKEARVLLHFDNCDGILSQDSQRDIFLEFLRRLFLNCPKVHTLFTARCDIAGKHLDVGGCSQRVFLLCKMTHQDSCQLFFKSSTKEITNAQILQLYEQTRFKGEFDQHPLFTELLNGHPQAISLAAALLSSNSLMDLYRMLLAKPLDHLVENEQITLQQRQSFNSFCQSLELTYKLVAHRDKDAARMFCLLGMLPAGASLQFLMSLFPVRCKHKLGLLIRHSLVHRSTREEDHYQTHPFISTYAQSKLNPGDRANFHNKIIQYLLSKVEVSYKYVGTTHLQSAKHMSEFQGQQLNIWAAVGREYLDVSPADKSQKEKQVLATNWGLRNQLRLKLVEEREEQASHLFQECRKSKEQRGGKQSVSSIHKLITYAATVLILNRNLGTAARMAKIGLYNSRKQGCPLSAANFARLLGTISLIQGKQNEAIFNYQGALRDFQSVGCSLGRALIQTALGYIHISKHQLHDSLDKLQSALKVYEEKGHKYAKYYLNSWLSMAKHKLFGKFVTKHTDQFGKFQRDVKESLKNNKINNLLFEKHKAGMFVFRSSLGNLSLFLQTAFQLDETPQKALKIRRPKKVESEDQDVLREIDFLEREEQPTCRVKSRSVYQSIQRRK